MIKLEDIHFSYENLPVLKGIDLEINKGEIISIIGASGAGKTTLLHILGTLEKPESGEYTINGKSTTKLSSNELAKIRNLEIGFIFQFHNLLVEFTAFENICIPCFFITGVRKTIFPPSQDHLATYNFVGVFIFSYCQTQGQSISGGGTLFL